MKKFFETPEVSSVELTETDVIMASPMIGVDAAAYTNVVKAEVSKQYDMWKGFEN